MKKLFVLSLAIFAISAVKSETVSASVKNSIKGLNATEEKIKHSKRGLRKQLKELNGTEVSRKAKFQFTEDFPEASEIVWERLDNFDEVTFEINGQTLSAFYDDKSELVGTTTIKAFSELPQRAQKTLNEKYKDYKVGDILYFDDNEQNPTDMILYNQQFDDKDNYFVELSKANKKILVQVSTDGEISYFTRLR